MHISSPGSKKIFIVIILCCCFTYFNQGGGYNQNATIGEIRGAVENSSFRIDSWASITGDISTYKGAVFSNKSPNMIWFAYTPYWLFYHTARKSGVDTESAGYQYTANHFITFVCATIWGALLSLVLFSIFRELYPELSVDQKLFLCLSLPLATLVFPYSTVAFVHAFEAFWISLAFLLWIKLIRVNSQRYLILFSLSYGVMLLANPLTVLVSPVVYLVHFRKNKSIKSLVIMSSLILIPLIPLFIYNYVNFDNPLKGNRNYLSDVYRDDDLLLGVFDKPDWSRLYKTFIYSHRSILPQVFLYGAFPGVYLLLKRQDISRELILFPLIIIAIFVAMILSFNGWHGGACFGPRYMMPAIVMMAVLSIPLYERYPRIYGASLFYSMGIMLIVTAINMMPSEFQMQPFVTYIWPEFLKGDFFQTPHGGQSFPGQRLPFYKYNLGTLTGIHRHWSLVPVVILIGASYYLLFGKKANPVYWIRKTSV